MIDQKKIEQAAQKYADNNKQLPRDFYGAEIVCKVDFQAGVRFAESEMGKIAQEFAEWCGSNGWVQGSDSIFNFKIAPNSII